MLASATIAWALFGLILLVIEVTSTTLIFLFFGIAALAVAGLRKFAGLDNFVIEAVIFGVLGLLCTLGFRKRLQAAFNKGTPPSFAGPEKFRLDADILPHSEAPITHQGSTWRVLNDSDEELKSGDMVTVQRIDGVKLVVKKV